MTETSGIGRRRAAARNERNAAYLEKLAQIVQAAVILFKEKGYEATTLNDIAAAVGTDRASLYYYVGSKEELLREAARDVTSVNTAAALRISETDAPAAEKIREFMVMLLTSYESNYPQIFVFIGQDLIKLVGQQSAWARGMVKQVRQLEQLVVTILEQGVADGSFRSDLNVEYAAQAIWGMVNWSHRWFRPGPKTSADEVARTFATIFLDGFGAPSKKKR